MLMTEPCCFLYEHLCAHRYAGIGGLSESLGWTDVQREEKQSSFMGGFENVIKLFSLILLADMLLFAYEQVRPACCASVFERHVESLVAVGWWWCAMCCMVSRTCMPL